MKNVQGKVVEKLEIHILCSIIFLFRKSYRLWNKVEKCCRAGQTTDDRQYGTCALRAGCLLPYTHTHTHTHTHMLRNTHCLSSASMSRYCLTTDSKFRFSCRGSEEFKDLRSVQKTENGGTIGSCTIQCALLHLHRSAEIFVSTANFWLPTFHCILQISLRATCGSSWDSRFDSKFIVLSVKEIQHDTTTGLAAVLKKDSRGASSNGRTAVASVYVPVRFQTYLYANKLWLSSGNVLIPRHTHHLLLH
jgi:hypothetical protein